MISSAGAASILIKIVLTVERTSAFTFLKQLDVIKKNEVIKDQIRKERSIPFCAEIESVQIEEA